MALELNLFVHGVPNGQNVWGSTEKGKNYVGGYYQPLKDDLRFYAERIADRCYYTYVLYRTPDSAAPNITAQDGRSGSYFGLTLSINAYYKDTLRIYRILDWLYHTYIYNRILKPNGSKLQYTISNFKEQEDLWKVMERKAVEMVQESASPEFFLNINSVGNSNGRLGEYNIDEVNNSFILSEMKKNGKVVLSPYLPTRRFQKMLQRKDEEMASVRTHCQNQVNTANDQLQKARLETSQKVSEATSALQRQNEKLQGQLNQAQQENNAWKQDSSVKKQIIQQLEKEKKHLQDQVENLNREINKLKGNHRQLGLPVKNQHGNSFGQTKGNEQTNVNGQPQNAPKLSQNSPRKKSPLGKLLKLIGKLIPILLLIIVFVMYFSVSNMKNDIQNMKKTMLSIDMKVEQMQTGPNEKEPKPEENVKANNKENSKKSTEKPSNEGAKDNKTKKESQNKESKATQESKSEQEQKSEQKTTEKSDKEE